MNTSNISYQLHFPLMHEESAVPLKVAALLLFGGLGAVGNIFVIVLAVKYTLWKNLHHLIINMAVADTSVTFSKTFLGVMKLFRYNFWNYFHGVWGEITCKTLSFFINVFVYESLVTLFVITVERFRVTRLTAQRSRPYTLKQRAIVLACCWLIPMVMATHHLVYRTFYRLYFRYRLLKGCFYNLSNWRFLVNLIHVRSSLVFFLLHIIFTVNIITLRRLSKPKAIQHHLSESQRQARTKRTRSATRMVLCSLLLYTCCYLPLFITDMINFLDQPQNFMHRRMFSFEYFNYFLLPVINSCFSPCIYIVFLPDFREAAKRLLKCGRITEQRVNRRVADCTQEPTAHTTTNNPARDHWQENDSQTTAT